MKTVTGTLLRGSGVPLVATLRFERSVSVSGATIYSGDVIMVTTGSDGAFSTTLAEGNYIVTWPRGVGGHPVSRLNIGVPAGDGSVALTDLIDQDYVSASTGPVSWATVEDMLAASSNTWVEGRTRNTIAGDGIRSGWDRVLKASEEGLELSDNGDSIRETDDGLAWAVRTWVAL